MLAPLTPPSQLGNGWKVERINGRAIKELIWSGFLRSEKNVL